MLTKALEIDVTQDLKPKYSDMRKLKTEHSEVKTKSHKSLPVDFLLQYTDLFHIIQLWLRPIK